jgi:hypothetical protein
LDETNLEARKPGNNLVVAHPPRANLEIRFASPPEEKTKVRRILGFLIHLLSWFQEKSKQRGSSYDPFLFS